MSFPNDGFAPVFSFAPTGAIALGHHQMPEEDKASYAAVPFHPGMPPQDVSDGTGPGFAPVGTAPLPWQARLPDQPDQPDYGPAWQAVEALADPSKTRGEFAFIDLRNTIMKTLGLARKPVDDLRSNDADGCKRWDIAKAITEFSSSPNPDPAQLDTSRTPITLTNVLAILDRSYAPSVDQFLPAVLTLLLLRHLDQGSAYDQAVMAHYGQAFRNKASEAVDADQANHRETEKHRIEFVQRAADAQRTYRELHPERHLADDQALPEDARQCLAQLADAYRANMSVERKNALITRLAAFTGAEPEPPEDAALTLRRILAFYESPRAGVVAPPSAATVLPMVYLAGWYDFQDAKSLAQGTYVPRALTGHPALPDAICHALRHYMNTKVAAEQPGVPQAAQAAQPSSIRDELQRLLAEVQYPGYEQFLQMLERAIAQCGPNLLDRQRNDPQALANISAELQQAAADESQREYIADAVLRLGEVMRTVIHSGTPAYEAYALALYRELAVPLPARERELVLNRLAAAHPELGCEDLQKQTTRFASRMMSFGYHPEDAEALYQSALNLRHHWTDTARAKDQLEALHDKSLDLVLDTLIAAAAQNMKKHPVKLGETLLAHALRTLTKDYGFTDQMLGKLSRDLTRYHSQADVDERAHIDERYRHILAPIDGNLGTVAMTKQCQHLIGVIHQWLENKPSEMGTDVAKTLADITGPTASLQDQLHLLAYFWRASYPGEPSDQAVKAQRELDAIKERLCMNPSHAMDVGKAAEFNNTVREALVKSLSDRMPGFGTAYTEALEAASAGSYAQQMNRMGALVSQWTVSPDAY